MTKLLVALLVLAAGAALARVALRAPEPSWTPPLAADAPVPPTLEGVAVPAGRVVRRFAVEGMCCGGCARKLHGALVAVAGVEAAAVDPVRGTAACVVAAEVDAARLAAALTFDAYVGSPLRDPPRPSEGHPEATSL